MKQHFCVVWNHDVAVSLIGDGIEQECKLYAAYHEEKMSSDLGYPHFAVHFANWFLIRGFRVYIYPYERARILDNVTLRALLWLGKKVDEVQQGVMIGQPKTAPETTLYLS